MYKIALALLCLLTLVGPASAAQPRDCVGPFSLTSQNVYAPGPDGANVRHIDGDMTVHVWKIGPDNISIDIQSTMFKQQDDPTGASFVVNDTKTGSDEITLKGPLERVRIINTDCSDGADAGTDVDCTAKVIICGRISN